MHPLEGFLLDTLNPATPPEAGRLAGLTPEQWRALSELAATQRVRALLWHRLKRKGVTDLLPLETATTLKDAVSQNALWNLRCYGELRTLLAALKAEGISVILLKGIYLADAVYDHMGLREMGDIDLLALPGDLRRIAATLTGMGYEESRPICPDVTFKHCHHLPPLVKRGHAAFEIHWNLLGPGETGYVAPDGFRERAVPVRVAGCDALALSPEDLLLHLCYHTSHHHQFATGLRPSCDIAAVIARFGPDLDWSIVVERAGRLGWYRGVYLALLMARDLVGAEVPADALERLRPAGMVETFPDAVRSQILDDTGVAATVSDTLAQVLESGSLFRMCRTFLRRVFVSRSRLASLYPVPVDSPLIYCWYPRRVFDLLRRHGRIAKGYREGDHRLREIVARKSFIADWLSANTD